MFGNERPVVAKHPLSAVQALFTSRQLSDQQTATHALTDTTAYAFTTTASRYHSWAPTATEAAAAQPTDAAYVAYRGDAKHNAIYSTVLPPCATPSMVLNTHTIQGPCAKQY